MSSRSSKFKLSIYALMSAVVSLAFQLNGADPLNPVKFWIIGICSFFLLSNLIVNKNILLLFSDKLEIKIIKSIIYLFCLSLLVAYINTDVKIIGILGFTGRNNGLLSYTFLSIIFLYISVSFIEKNLVPLFNTIFFLVFIFSVYGVLQHFNLDPIKWNAQYNKIVLTVGNPNFAAALLALLSVFVFTYLLISTTNIQRLISGISFLIIILVIYWTHAIQGIVATTLGIGILLVLRMSQVSRKASLILVGFGSIGGLFSILGMLNFGPLARFLYKASVTDRGYNWRAAWNMFKAHPWTGVGLDRYAAYFGEFKDKKYPLIYGYTQSVNNSHNVFLELLATGGIFVAISYISLILFIGYRAIIAWQNYSGKAQMHVAGVITGWLIFIAQSVISIDNLAISIWGWVLGGAIVGLSSNIENPTIKNELAMKSRYKAKSKQGVAKLKITTLTLIFSIAFAFVITPMYKVETGFADFKKVQIVNTQEGRNAFYKYADKIFDQQFMNSDYRAYIALVVTNLGNVDLGIKMYSAILEEDPRRFDAHQFLASIYESQHEYELAVKHRLLAQKLNPWGADSLIELVKDYKAIGDITSSKKVANSIIEMAPNSDLAKQAQSFI